MPDQPEPRDKLTPPALVTMPDKELAATNARDAVRAGNSLLLFALVFKHWCIEREYLVEGITGGTGLAAAAAGGVLAPSLWALLPGGIGLIAFVVFVVAKYWREKDRTAESTKLLRKLHEANAEIDRLRADNDANSQRIENFEADLHEVEERASSLRDALDIVMDRMLWQLLHDQGLADDNTRASFYMWQGAGMGALVSVGRYSSNPRLAERSLRVHLTSEGIIGLAWQQGSHYKGDCPLDLGGRRAFHRSLQFPNEKMLQLRNPVRAYLARRIDLGPQRHLGVLVLESLRPDGFDACATSLLMALNCDLDGSPGRRFADFVAQLYPFFDNVSSAKQASM